jgi:hypothetical protein
MFSFFFHKNFFFSFACKINWSILSGHVLKRKRASERKKEREKIVGKKGNEMKKSGGK